jgi:hypothetical protein
MRLRRLKEALLERASEGWRLLATATHGFGGSSCALLTREKTDRAARDYRFLDECDGPEVWQGWLQEGYRILEETGGALIALERDPAEGTLVEYRVVIEESTAELLDSASEALTSGFRVLRFLGEDSLMLYRHSPADAQNGEAAR